MVFGAIEEGRNAARKAGNAAETADRLAKDLGDGNKKVVNETRIVDARSGKSGEVSCTVCQDRRDIKKRTEDDGYWQVRKCPGCGDNRFVCKFHCNGPGARRYDCLEWVDGTDDV